MRVLVLMITNKMSAKTYFTGAFIPAGLLQILRENRHGSVGSLILYEDGSAMNSFFNIKICWCCLSEPLPVEKTLIQFLSYLTFFSGSLRHATYYNIIPNIHNKKNHQADHQFAEWFSPTLNRYSFAGSKINKFS